MIVLVDREQSLMNFVILVNENSTFCCVLQTFVIQIVDYALDQHIDYDLNNRFYKIYSQMHLGRFMGKYQFSVSILIFSGISFLSTKHIFFLVLTEQTGFFCQDYIQTMLTIPENRVTRKNFHKISFERETCSITWLFYLVPLALISLSLLFLFSTNGRPQAIQEYV